MSDNDDITIDEGMAPVALIVFRFHIFIYQGAVLFVAEVGASGTEVLSFASQCADAKELRTR